VSQNAKFCAPNSALLGYVCVSEEASIKHVGALQFVDWNEIGYT